MTLQVEATWDGLVFYFDSVQLPEVRIAYMTGDIDCADGSKVGGGSTPLLTVRLVGASTRDAAGRSAGAPTMIVGKGGPVGQAILICEDADGLTWALQVGGRKRYSISTGSSTSLAGGVQTSARQFMLYIAR